ncbi:MAG: Ppx/GppA phosphatase family protein [Inquilinaceae bacterium]
MSHSDMGSRGRFAASPITPAWHQRVAVIDIGSNSIRLVVYDGLGRAPLPIFNEKVLCGLGRGLASTGRLNPDGVKSALESLARFTRLLSGMEVDHVDVLATAAVREAADGQDFIEQVDRVCGLAVSVVSGAEEARISAMGVLSGIPGADGVIGDLGGGSLEMVGIDKGVIGDQVTLPLGPFRLMDAKGGRGTARKTVDSELQGLDWLETFRGRTFYPVGGAWRSIAKLLMATRDHPLHIIHQFAVDGDDLLDVARLIAGQGKASMDRMPGVSKRRLETLPWAALVLEGVLQRLRPERVVFSAFGVREGHLFDLLTPAVQAEDPLIAACAKAAKRIDRFSNAERFFAWLDPLFEGESAWHRRLRQAASLLSDICWAEHPDYRADHAFLRVQRLPFAGFDHVERVFVAAALYARYGGSLGGNATAAANDLLDGDQMGQAAALGAALRLAHTLTGGATDVLERTRLSLDSDKVTLWLPEQEECLGGEVVRRRLNAVAKALSRTAETAVAMATEVRTGT